jgi:hypothetical protein
MVVSEYKESGGMRKEGTKHLECWNEEVRAETAKCSCIGNSSHDLRTRQPANKVNRKGDSQSKLALLKL